MSRTTRSRLALPDFDIAALGRSPLKDARAAQRSVFTAETVHDPPMTDTNRDDDMLAGDRRRTKRPSSPELDGGVAEMQERVVKRAKRDEEEETTPGECSTSADETHATSTLRTASTPPKSQRSGSSVSLPLLQIPPRNPRNTEGVPRAQSVPLGPLVHLDLTQVPPSPWRSPSKSKGKGMLRLTSVPPPDLAVKLFEPTPQPKEPPSEDVTMAEPPPVELALPPPPLQPSSPITPLPDSAGSPASPLSPLSPTPNVFEVHPSHRDIEVEVKLHDGDTEKPRESQYQDIEVAVKTHDGEAEIEEPPSRPRTSSTGSRIPRPPSVQLTLHEVVAAMPRAMVPKKGVVGRMKSKNGGTPPRPPPLLLEKREVKGRSSQARGKTPIPGASRSKTPVPVARARTPAVAPAPAPRARTPGVAPAQVTRAKTPSAIGTSTPARSKTPNPGSIANTSRAKTPNPVAGPSRTKTPAPTAPAPSSLSQTPIVQRPRTPASEIPRPKTPARSQTVATDRAKTPGAEIVRPKTPSRNPGLVRAKTPLPASSRSGPPSPTSANMDVDMASPNSPKDVYDPAPLTEQPALSPSTKPISPVVAAKASEVVLDRQSALTSTSPTAIAPVSDAGDDNDVVLNSTTNEPNGILPNTSGPSRAIPLNALAEPVAARTNQVGRKTAPPKKDIPLGGRMTRSASLRQKENTKGLGAPDKGKGKEPARTPESSVASTIDNSSGGAPPTTPGRSLAHRRRSQSFSSFARPTTASSAKSNPPSPTKPRPPASTAVSRPSTSIITPRPPASTSRIASSVFSEPAPSKLSLSTLSQALAKLNKPAPSRPNTSMGFNRDKGKGITSDSEGEPSRPGSAMDIESTSKVGASQDDSAARTVHTRPRPFQRAATVGPSSGSSSSRHSDELRHSDLMLPPPVPSSKTPIGVTNGTAAPKARINLSSGMIAGKPKGQFVFGNGTARPRIFGVAPAPGYAGQRVVHKASKPSSLPVVEGSPVKGGGDVTMAEVQDSEPPLPAPDFGRSVSQDMEDEFFQAGSSSLGFHQDSLVPTSDGVQNDQLGEEKAKERNTSRRASMARHNLEQTLGAQPRTPLHNAPATDGKGKARAVSSNYPSGQHTAPAAVSNGTGAHVARATRSSTRHSTTVANGTAGSVANSPSDSTPESSKPQKPKTMKILKGCNVFVDVKAEGGEDAGGFFVDMLITLGARILSRVGSSCTHIVYKNGLVSTVTRYRLLNEKPLVVGIAWVVECAEQGARVDEKQFSVDLTNAHIAGTNKRRKSMLPKHLMDSPERRPYAATPPTVHGESSNNQPKDVTSSPTSEDTTPNDSFDHLPPLERARLRRQSSLFPQ